MINSSDTYPWWWLISIKCHISSYSWHMSQVTTPRPPRYTPVTGNEQPGYVDLVVPHWVPPRWSARRPDVGPFFHVKISWLVVTVRCFMFPYIGKNQQKVDCEISEGFVQPPSSQQFLEIQDEKWEFSSSHYVTMLVTTSTSSTPNLCRSFHDAPGCDVCW